MLKLVTRTPATKATKATTIILTATTTTTSTTTKTPSSAQPATHTITDMHFNNANIERKRSCRQCSSRTPQSISCCNHNYQHNNDNNNKLNKYNKNNHRNNYNLPPLFAFNRHLLHATLLLLVCAVYNCCAGGVGSNESLAFAPAVPRPVHRRHTTAIVKDNSVDTDDPSLVFVYKCCEKFEIHVDGVCTQVNESGKATQKKRTYFCENIHARNKFYKKKNKK